MNVQNIFDFMMHTCIWSYLLANSLHIAYESSSNNIENKLEIKVNTYGGFGLGSSLLLLGSSFLLLLLVSPSIGQLIYLSIYITLVYTHQFLAEDSQALLWSPYRATSKLRHSLVWNWWDICHKSLRTLSGSGNSNQPIGAVTLVLWPLLYI